MDEAFLHEVAQCQVAAALAACFFDSRQDAIHRWHRQVAWRDLSATLIPRHFEYLGYADLPDVTRGNEVVALRGDDELGLLERGHQARDGDLSGAIVSGSLRFPHPEK